MSIVITGNPGVGKHTIAQEIIKNQDYDLVDINEIAIKSNHVEISDNYVEVDVEALRKDIKSMISKKSLIVGHLAPYVLSKPDVSFAIILRRSPYKLVQVYEKRRYSEDKIKENVGSEIIGIITYDVIAEFGNEKTFQIDVTEKTPKVVAERIQNIIQKQNHGDEIDWLSEIKQNDDFQKFFDY